MSRFFRGLRGLFIVALLCAAPAPSFAAINFDFGVSVDFGPPALPYYVQPPCPQANFIWMPGYWAWGPAGYYWVPGTWVAAAQPGLLWTPGYWGYSGDRYVWYGGYWAPQVGFYGGINYGYGYFGAGFVGGGWSGNTFRYNTAVTNVNRTIVRNVYVNRTVVNNYFTNPSVRPVSFNGGRGGVQAHPTRAQLMVARARHTPLTALQRQHIETAAADRNYLATVNKGRPPQPAVARPFAANRKPANFVPVRPQDRRTAQTHVVARPAAPAAPRKAPPKRPAPQTARPPVHHPAARPQPQHPATRPHPVRQPEHMARPPQHHAPQPRPPQQHAPPPHPPAQHAPQAPHQGPQHDKPPH